MKYILIALFFASSGAYAQYVMTKSTFSSAGNSSSSANYILKDAAGQSVTGQSEAPSHIEQAGFYTYSEQKLSGVADKSDLVPKVFSLSQPYPNPVTKGATVKYGVPRLSQVNIRVYDVTGRVVRTLASGEKKAGFYSLRWDGTTDQGARVAQGIFFIRMLAPEFKATKKIVLLK